MRIKCQRAPQDREGPSASGANGEGCARVWRAARLGIGAVGLVLSMAACGAEEETNGCGAVRDTLVTNAAYPFDFKTGDCRDDCYIVPDYDRVRPGLFVARNQEIFFQGRGAAASGAWVSDGTPSGTHLFASDEQGAISNRVRGIRVVATSPSRLFYAATVDAVREPSDFMEVRALTCTH